MVSPWKDGKFSNRSSTKEMDVPFQESTLAAKFEPQSSTNQNDALSQIEVQPQVGVAKPPRTCYVSPLPETSFQFTMLEENHGVTYYVPHGRSRKRPGRSKGI